MELRLTREEINNLIFFHKTLKNKNDADKIKCIIYWGKGWTWEQIKEQFGINYTADGMVLTLKRLGYRYKKPKKVPGKMPSESKQKEFAESTNKIIENLGSTEAAYFGDGSGLVHNVKT